MYPAQGNPQYTPSCVFDVEKEGIDLDRDELQALLSDKAPVKQTKSANLVISTIEMEDEMVIDNVSRPGIWDLLSQPFAGRVDGLPDNSPSSPTRGPQGPSFDSLVHYFL